MPNLRQELEITEIRKLKTPIDENLNEGLPLGSMTILAGVPGAGKSTLDLEIVWDVIQTKLPELELIAKAILKDLGG